jgi:hypothetical protein
MRRRKETPRAPMAQKALRPAARPCLPRNSRRDKISFSRHSPVKRPFSPRWRGEGEVAVVVDRPEKALANVNKKAVGICGIKPVHKSSR